MARHGLSDRIRVIASGKLVTPRPVAWALCVGADFVVRPRLHVCPWLHPGPEVQQEHLPNRHHDAQSSACSVAWSVEDKAERVYTVLASTMHKEIGIIAHSCGVSEPRGLKRYHCRIVQDDGRSIPLDELYPYQNPS